MCKMRHLRYHSHAIVYIFVAFIVRFCSVADSGQDCYVCLLMHDRFVYESYHFDHV